MIGIPASRQGDTGQPGDNVDVLLSHAGYIGQDTKNVNLITHVNGRNVRVPVVAPKDFAATRANDRIYGRNAAEKFAAP